jgi:hypothetical protein
MRNLIIACFVMCSMSCSSYKVYKYDNLSVNQDGVRFYRPDSYLLITRDENSGKLTYTIIYLPNKNEEYVIKKKGFIGKAELTVKLDNGWNLTGYGLNTDTQIPETILSS